MDKKQPLTVFITGGAGFIGSAVIRHLIENTPHRIVNIDKLTYAGNLSSLAAAENNPRHEFIQADICDTAKITPLFYQYQPDAIMHLAAESHVDRAIDEPVTFIHTNILGTYTLLEAARNYWTSLPPQKKPLFRFHHVSTDEVYGDLEKNASAFTEEHPYQPSSPYSASKASSDHLVRAWHRTYGLPTLITNCSNNYGPYHFPEKFIPHMILNALKGKPLPIYGDGSQIRDWLYVEDHARALVLTLFEGHIGETYNIGGNNEKKNIDVVHSICDFLEKHAANKKPPHINQYSDLITFVRDRPGHDKRYAIDNKKITQTLKWQPQETFETGLEKTVKWFLDNEEWWRAILNGTYILKRRGEA